MRYEIEKLSYNKRYQGGPEQCLSSCHEAQQKNCLVKAKMETSQQTSLWKRDIPLTFMSKKTTNDAHNTGLPMPHRTK